MVDWNELLENDNNYKNIFQVMIQKEFKTTPEYYVLNIDEEQKYTMGVYLCLGNVNIHNVNVDDAVDFKRSKHFKILQVTIIHSYFSVKHRTKLRKKPNRLLVKKQLN